MAVQSATTSITYSGNNSTVTAYVIPFLFYKDTHIQAIITDADGVETELDLTTDFTVTGEGDEDGGNLLTVEAWDNTHDLTIRRKMPATQPFVFEEGQRLGMKTLEKALDYLLMFAAWIRDESAGNLPQFQTSATHIQWKYPAETAWTNLASFDDIGLPSYSTDIDSFLAAANAAAARTALGIDEVNPPLTSEESAGMIPYRLPIAALSPYTDPDADAAITAAGITDERGKNHYQRIVQLFKGIGAWDSLENAYLFGTGHQSSSTTLKSITGTSDATGTATHGTYAATFNGTSDKYLFSNVSAATDSAGKTFIALYKDTPAQAVRALVSNYQGGTTRGPVLWVNGSSVGGTGPSLVTSIFGFATVDGSGITEGQVALAADGKVSFAAMSLLDGVCSTYGNHRNPTRFSLATIWNNNANLCIGANPNDSQWLTGEMHFAAVLNAGLTDAQVFAIKNGLESILSDVLTPVGGVVFEGNSLTASAPGGGSTWPAKLIATAGWTTLTRYVNISADGARQTQRIEQQYFTKARPWLQIAGRDQILFLWTGVNDITAGITTAVITASIRRHIMRAVADGFRVVALTITPVAPASAGLSYGYSAGQLTQISDINTWLKTTGALLGAQIVDLDEIGDDYPDFLDPTDSTYYVTGDGLHHNDAGRALIAAKIDAEVTPPINL